MAAAGQWSRRAVVAGLASAPVLLTAACSGSGKSPGSSSGGDKGAAGNGSSAPAASKAQVTVTPKDGATAVSMGSVVKLVVLDGTVQSAVLTAADGTAVPGEFSGGQTNWASTGPLASSTSYTLTAKLVDKDGTPSTSVTRFTTGKPAKTFVGYYTPEDGSTVGVGMPVSVNFNHPVSSARRAAVEKAISVTASPAVEVVGHWFSPTRLDFRPAEYWAPGTRVTLRLRLKDVEGAEGRYGVQSKDVSFTIGRSQTSVVDLAAKTMTVTRDGKVTQRWKVTGGSPQHTTWGGRMVISEKFLQTRMNSQTVGLGGEYDIKDVPHAQRLTTSGTFIHGNYWTAVSVFGSANVSHGCIGLHDVKGAGDASTPAAQFYNSSMTGDVVEVRNSGDRVVAADNGLNCWNLSWADWKAGSAL